MTQYFRVHSLLRHFPITFITLLAFALRLPLLTTFPLREDEALYGFWARHFLHEDPWFLHVWLDKPPLFIWSLAGAFSLFGESAAGGRLLNIFLSTLTIPALAATARRLWGERPAQIAALALACNPFAISFAPTLFTDPLLVLAGTLAIHRALTGRAFGAGLWLATAIMTKQQGVFYLPLVIWLVWRRVGECESRRVQHSLALTLSTLLKLLFGLSLILIPILLWDSLRWSVAPSPWDLSVRNYAAMQLASPSSWLPRAQAWGDLLWYLTASWWLWGYCAVQTVQLGTRGLLAQWQSWRTHYPIWRKVMSPTSTRGWFTTLPFRFSPAALDQGGLALWSFGFLTFHLLTTVQIWDRYLLPLAPMVALSFAWIENRLHTSTPVDYKGQVRALLLLLLFLPPAFSAARGGMPIGGDHGAYLGLEELVAELQDQGGVVYHHALGWHFQFYLYEPIRHGEVEVRWFSNGATLADNASKTPHRRKFLGEADWGATPNLEFHLRTRALRLERRMRVGNFTLYEIVQLPQPPCAWCVCRDRSTFPALLVDADNPMLCRK